MKIKYAFLVTILVTQSFLIIGIAIWGITQKVEAKKQKILKEEIKYSLEKAVKNSIEISNRYQSLKDSCK